MSRRWQAKVWELCKQVRWEPAVGNNISQCKRHILYNKQFKNSGLDFENLFQIWNEGLICLTNMIGKQQRWANTVFWTEYEYE